MFVVVTSVISTGWLACVVITYVSCFHCLTCLSRRNLCKLFPLVVVWQWIQQNSLGKWIWLWGHHWFGKVKNKFKTQRVNGFGVWWELARALVLTVNLRSHHDLLSRVWTCAWSSYKCALSDLEMRVYRLAFLSTAYFSNASRNDILLSALKQNNATDSGLRSVAWARLDGNNDSVFMFTV